jgi:hypothetical protein
MKHYFLYAAFAVVATSQLGATDCGQITRDEGFDLWCGNQLCVWKLVRGDVRRAATWHDADSGVELLGSDTAISQLTSVNSFDGECIRFDLTANVAETAEVTLGVDVEGDGTIDHVERVPTATWKPVSFRLLVKAPYDGIRFELAKRGEGTAILARIDAELATDCAGLTPIVATQRPDGASCTTGADCASGTCSMAAFLPPGGSSDALACNECTTGSCATGETCGYAEPLAPVLAGYSECVALGSHQLAEHCVVDEECASGICEGNYCSACRTDASCAHGTCRPAWTYGFFGLPGPVVCAPGEGKAVAGEACATDGDCASLHCDGTARKECDDGRACFDRDNCPVDSTLEPGECNLVGVQGGRCR